MHGLIKYRWLLSILAFAAILRVIGVWHGYPFSYYPDEAHFVKRALSFGSGDLNPHWFHKPAFLMYLLFAEYGVLFIVGAIGSMWDSVEQFAVSYISNPGPFYLIGRLTIVAFSLGTIATVYLLGERFFRRGTGLFAALLLTVSFGHVVASQDIKADIPAAFFTIISVYALLAFVDQGRTKFLLLAAGLAGAGAATKYYPYAMLAPVAIAILYRCDWANSPLRQSIREAISNGFLALLTFYGTFFVLSPYNFIDPLGRIPVFRRAIDLLDTMWALASDGAVQYQVPESIRVGTTRLESITDYGQQLLATSGMGWIVGGTCLLGLPALAYRNNARARIFLIFPLLFFFISTVMFPGYVQTRHQLPIYPFLAVCGGFLIATIIARLSHPRVAMAVVLALLLIPTARIIERDLYVSKGDTRTIAKAWIESNIPANTKVVLDEMGPVLFTSADQLRTSIEQASGADPSGQFTAHYDRYLNYQLKAAENVTTYEIEEIRFPWWRDSEPEDGVYELDRRDKDMGNPLRAPGVKTLDEYDAMGYRMYVLSSERYNSFIKPENYRYKNFPSFRRFYLDLFERGELIKEFNPDTDNRPGPTIRIMRFPPASTR